MTTAIQTLLLSGVLPRDVIVQEIFGKHLYKYESPLNDLQKDSIVQNNFLFKKLVILYYNTYNRRMGSPDYFLSVLDNDMFLAINEGYYYFEFKSDFLESNPTLVETLLTGVSEYDLPEYIYDVWCTLDNDKRREVYDFLVNRFVDI